MNKGRANARMQHGEESMTMLDLVHKMLHLCDFRQARISCTL